MKYILSILIGTFTFFSQHFFKTENSINSLNCETETIVLVEGAIGIITTNENYRFGDKINVLNKKQQIIEQLVINEEYKTLAIKCLSVDDNFYKIKFSKDRIGYIKKTQKGIVFQTWEQHILSLFTVGFKENENPIKVTPEMNSNSIGYDSNEFYRPSEIIDEWLKVKWGSKNKWEYGWIKWKEKEKLLIEFFYFA